MYVYYWRSSLSCTMSNIEHDCWRSSVFKTIIHNPGRVSGLRSEEQGPRKTTRRVPVTGFNEYNLVDQSLLRSIFERRKR